MGNNCMVRGAATTGTAKEPLHTHRKFHACRPNGRQLQHALLDSPAGPSSGGAIPTQLAIGQGDVRRQRAPGLKLHLLTTLRAMAVPLRELTEGNPLGVPLPLKATVLTMN